MVAISYICLFIAFAIWVIAGIQKASEKAEKERLEKVKEILDEYHRRNNELFSRFPDRSKAVEDAKFEVLNDDKTRLN